MPNLFFRAWSAICARCRPIVHLSLRYPPMYDISIRGCDGVALLRSSE